MSGVYLDFGAVVDSDQGVLRIRYCVENQCSTTKVPSARPVRDGTANDDELVSTDPVNVTARVTSRDGLEFRGAGTLTPQAWRPYGDCYPDPLYRGKLVASRDEDGAGVFTQKPLPNDYLMP